MSESQDSENSVQSPQSPQVDSQGQSAAAPAPQPITQPEYGQRKVPDYGAIRSQFPENYDPYVFGKAEEQPKANGGNKPQRFPNPFSGFGQQNGNGSQGDANQFGRSGQPQSGQNQPGGPSFQGWGPNNASYGSNASNGGRPGSAFGGYGQNGQGQMPQNGQDANHVPDMRGGIDMNDPNQNPLWGHWSAMAIFSFICSLCGMSYLAVILGAFSIWRTKLYHMRGRGLAIAAVVIGIVFILLEIWIMSNPAMMSLLQQMMDTAGVPDFGASSV